MQLFRRQFGQQWLKTCPQSPESIALTYARIGFDFTGDSAKRSLRCRPPHPLPRCAAPRYNDVFQIRNRDPSFRSLHAAKAHWPYSRGGGDVPGLNSVIKTVVYRGTRDRLRSHRHPPGLGGLDARQPPGPRQPVPLRPSSEPGEHPDHRSHGGTYLHSSRTNPSKDEEVPPVLEGQEFPKKETTKKGVTSMCSTSTSAVLKNIETLGLDYLVAIGGDDTLSYAAELGSPGHARDRRTEDHGQRRAEYRVLHRLLDRQSRAPWTPSKRQRTTVGSHERIGLFRVFGRDAGYTALYTAYVTSVRCCIPEYKVDLKKLIRPAGHRQAQ